MANKLERDKVIPAALYLSEACNRAVKVGGIALFFAASLSAISAAVADYFITKKQK